MKDPKLTPTRPHISDLLANDDGVTAIEYGLVAALISVFILVAIGALGDAVVGLFDLANRAVPN